MAHASTAMKALALILCFACAARAQERSVVAAIQAVREDDFPKARSLLPEQPEILTLPEYAALSLLGPDTVAYLRPLVPRPDADAPVVRRLQALARRVATEPQTAETRTRNLAAARGIGPVAVPALIAMLEAPQDHIRREAAMVLDTLGDPRALAPRSTAAHVPERYLRLAERYLAQVELDLDSYAWSRKDGLIATPTDPIFDAVDRAEEAVRKAFPPDAMDGAPPHVLAVLERVRGLRLVLATGFGTATGLERAHRDLVIDQSNEYRWRALDDAVCARPSFPVHALLLDYCTLPRGIVASLWSDSRLVRNRAIAAAARVAATLSGTAKTLPFELPDGDPEAVEAARRLLLAADLTADEAQPILRAIEEVSGPVAMEIPLGPDSVEVAPEFERVAIDPVPTEVVVFYGTDRAVFKPDFPFYAFGFLWAGIAAVMAFLVPRMIRWTFREHLQVLAPIARWTGWAATVLLAVTAAYGSARTHLRHERLGFEYGGERGPFDDPSGPYCHFGSCVVGIPPAHLSGELEAPQPLKGDLWEDPDKHVVLLSIRPEADSEQFFGSVRARAEEGGNSAFIFVHGFNVTFEDAALRTAQMTYDLNFLGAPIFFSWPSRGSLVRYTADESTVAWATGHLKRFLRDVRTRLPTATIHLVAHSMGNRALTEALRRLAHEIDEKQLPRFQEVVLAAPDIDGPTFRDDIVPAIRSTAERVTLYASSSDEALLVSKTVHGYPRAGDSGDLLVVVNGVQTIDVSASLDSSVLGHSYYGSVGRVLDDLVALLAKRRMPKERGLAEVLSDGGVHWRLE